MKHFYLFIFPFLLFSCMSKEKKIEDIDVISWESALKNDTSFLESIDIIPLETDSDILVKTPSLFQYIKAIDAFLLMDSRSALYLFDRNGRHCSNSVSCIGEGPKEYVMAVDAEYNPYTNFIELYNAHTSSIHCYDLQFHWKQTIKLKQEVGFAAQTMSVLRENVYALDPVRLNEEDLYMKVYDFSNNEAVITNVPYHKSGYIAETNMMRKSLQVIDSNIYYTPDYMDYHFYQYNVEEGRFFSIYRLDFGKESVSKKKLDELYGKSKPAKGKEVLKSVSIMQEKNDYLLSSHYPLPIIRLINDSYVYVHFICNRTPHNLIYNRKTKKIFGLTPNSPLIMYRCFNLVDNVLYSILYPYELDRYINETTKKYLSEDALKRLENIREEDNPVVIKYVLKNE